jgi:hypothetical protein
MTLRKRSNGTFQFQDHLVVAQKIIRDHGLLIDFFKIYIQDLLRGGLKPCRYEETAMYDLMEAPLYHALEPILSLARFIITASPQQFAIVQHELIPIFEVYGIDGLRLVQACVYCHPLLTNPKDRQQWISDAKALFDQGNESYSSQQLEEYGHFDSITYNNTVAGDGNVGLFSSLISKFLS